MTRKVFLNSLPKSGTNLAAKCLELLGYTQSGRLDASLVLGNGVKQKLRKLYFSLSIKEGYSVGIDTPVALSRSAVRNVLRRARSDNFVTGHLGYTNDLLFLVKEMGFAPILMLRDPRAVLNSFVHYVSSNPKHALNSLMRNVSEERRYEIGLLGISKGKIMLRPLLERCNALEIWRRDPDVFTMKFEELVGPAGGGDKSRQNKSISDVAGFIGVTQFDSQHIAAELFGPGRHTFRRGSIQGWHDEMPLNAQELVTVKLREVLFRWGYI